MEWLVTTPDGRTLAVEDAGDPDDRPVWCTSAPRIRGTGTAAPWQTRPPVACG
jgi:hypothetical protein